ncbi:MAG: MIP/aquaporin family protein [Bacilli bacterium]
MLHKGIAEFLGTFTIVLFGTGTAVLSGGKVGVDTLGIAMAFGTAFIAMAYSVGVLSGAHLNPAVSVALYINKRIPTKDLLYYIVAQVLGACFGSMTLLAFLRYAKLDTSNLGQNTYGTLGMGGAFLVEAILTFVFVLVVVAVTGKKGNKEFAGLVIGLSLVLVHLLGIPLTGTSVNPARSLAPALFAGGGALGQVWVFILAPIVGGIVAAVVGKMVFASEGGKGK